MKTKNFLFVLFILLLYSCSPQEDIVTFYGEDTLSKEMIVSTTINEELQNSFNSSVTIDLLDSKFFEKYIDHLIELKATSIKISITDYNYGIVNSKLEMGNDLLIDNCIDEISQSEGSITITDPEVLGNISNRLMYKHKIPFILSGSSRFSDTFTVSISVTFNGVFGD
ncbi:hypothetical protein [Pseudotenacibaculum haliotis]|uniref:Lipid/polyisoprenoid-binding YceI-like domain-containing protein n=1 Tax=Pseudotenacibaculum haliotis TaxID=1862138 RepID=A0ABW5LVR6_9FLAO